MGSVMAKKLIIYRELLENAATGTMTALSINHYMLVEKSELTSASLSMIWPLL